MATNTSTARVGPGDVLIVGDQRDFAAHLHDEKPGSAPRPAQLHHLGRHRGRNSSGKLDSYDPNSDQASESRSSSQYSDSSCENLLDDGATTPSSEIDGVPTMGTTRGNTGRQPSDCVNSAVHIQTLEHSSQSAYIERGQSIRSLDDELCAAWIPTFQGGSAFFPEGQLSEILTEERVRSELANHFKSTLTAAIIAKYAQKICGETALRTEDTGSNAKAKARSYIKILAILILAGKTKAIVKILEDPEGISDLDLPLIKKSQSKQREFYDLRTTSKPDTVLKCFEEDWSQINTRRFEELQWATLPLVFSRSETETQVEHYVLHERTVLPFISDTEIDGPQSLTRTELEGGFARVFKVKIHRAHHSFHSASKNSGNAFFALKTLRLTNRDAFDREVEMLKKFSDNKHPHLISLLATYEQFGRFFLIFDWAQADLQRYWTEENPRPSFDQDTVLWLARQCKGIAHGISNIHKYASTYAKPESIGPENQKPVFGHHGDIKPENVLWFAESGREDCKAAGTLKLSDFGLAEFSIHETMSMIPEGKRGVSLGYRAPEADLDQDAAIGRSYDIWTLGCLYLEFITWMLGGRKLLKRFLQQRKARDQMWHYYETHTFFMIEVENGVKTAVIKPVVNQFFQELHQHPNCSAFIHEFLNIVESKLLVVKKNDRRQIDRISIEQVHQELARMVQRCETDSVYAIGPVRT